jgi:endonuclease YncB( thermonuclease family)
LLFFVAQISFATELPVPVHNKEPLDTESLKQVEATVLYCNDGDTCRVKVAGGMWLNVRLAGIDAPEVSSGKKKAGQPFGEESKNFLNNHAKGKTIQIRQTDLDQYNRPVVEILVEGLNINRKIVQSGYAEAYRGKTKRIDNEAYLGDETTAKKAGLGIWSQKEYVSPALFRKDRKSK